MADDKPAKRARASVHANLDVARDQLPAFWTNVGAALRRNATQGVRGEGSDPATIMLVGEQPGEDLQGTPFVGPAGALLGKALAETGVVRGDIM